MAIDSIKYPIYIVSKGRWEKTYTADFLNKENIPFKICVEPQEYDLYCHKLGKESVLELPFSNLGLGSYPARNYAWEDSIKNGHKKHYLFDDNIRGFKRLNNGKRIKCSAVDSFTAMERFTDRYQNIGLAGFNYTYFAAADLKKPFFVNTHCYSGILIDNSLKFRWRLKYNEDVDLCLQVLHSGLCTISMNAFLIEKISTVKKMKGGNQDELYLGNAYEKKVLKAKSLEQIWPQYVKTTIRFNRPHHHVSWRKHFKQELIRIS